VGSAMVPLDRVLPSSYRLSILMIPLSVKVSTSMAQLPPSPNLLFPWLRIEPLSNAVLLGTTRRVSLPAGTSFRPKALAGCTSVRHIQTDGQTTLR